MALKKGYQQLVAEAEEEIRTLSAAEAGQKHGDPDVVFVDIRDIRELERGGMVPGAYHAPRGMLEFWVDPESPYHKEIFASDRELVLYCASGWRSALATRALQEMGLEKVCHVEGGFTAWKSAGLPVAEREQKKRGP